METEVASRPRLRAGVAGVPPNSGNANYRRHSHALEPWRADNWRPAWGTWPGKVIDSFSSESDAGGEDSLDVPTVDEPLTISEAKRRLAKSRGVSEADIKITITS